MAMTTRYFPRTLIAVAIALSAPSVSPGQEGASYRERRFDPYIVPREHVAVPVAPVVDEFAGSPVLDRTGYGLSPFLGWGFRGFGGPYGGYAGYPFAYGGGWGGYRFGGYGIGWPYGAGLGYGYGAGLGWTYPYGYRRGGYPGGYGYSYPFGDHYPFGGGGLGPHYPSPSTDSGYSAPLPQTPGSSQSMSEGAAAATTGKFTW